MAKLLPLRIIIMHHFLQSFDISGDASCSAERLEKLRSIMREKNIQAFLVPRSDEHQSEYVRRQDDRLLWLTGFSGSAGLCIVLPDQAGLFVDGRYPLQARAETDADAVTVISTDTKPSEWLTLNLHKGDKVGFDPWLHTSDFINKYQKDLEVYHIELVELTFNPIDKIWHDRPQPALNPVVNHPISCAGETRESKLARIKEKLAQQNIDALLLSDPQNIAWAFNCRGSDVPFNPLAFGYAIISCNSKALMFFDHPIDPILQNSLDQNLFQIFPKSELSYQLRHLGFNQQKIRLDHYTCSEAITSMLKQNGILFKHANDPITEMKAVKNTVEIEGARRAHLRDGIALTRFLAWFAMQAPSGHLNEIEATQKLESFRHETGLLRDLSFPTIAGSGPNGAIVHYRVTHQTNRMIEKNNVFLIDSGAQYQDGTTDVTRTILAGDAPSHDIKEYYTLVLKGHIAIARARFPKGTSGSQLDVLARIALWERGLDFDHGTGHGVGSYLCVHEGPQRISKTGLVALEKGMILSNEPGYYKAGHYGIRLENLLLVQEHEAKFSDKTMYAFETLTLAPFERSLIKPSMLNAVELQWLNDYHLRVFKKISPHLIDEEKEWLKQATKPFDSW